MISRFFEDLLKWKRPFYTTLFGFFVCYALVLNPGLGFISLTLIFLAVIWSRFLWIQICDSSIGELLGADQEIDQNKRLEQNISALHHILLEYESKLDDDHRKKLLKIQKLTGKIWWAYNMILGALNSPIELSKFLGAFAFAALFIPARWIIFFSFPCILFFYNHRSSLKLNH
jgi:hypothetical protein